METTEDAANLDTKKQKESKAHSKGKLIIPQDTPGSPARDHPN